MTVPNHAINAILIPNLPFDSVKDFAPVTTLSTSDYVLVVHPSVPAESLKAFVAFARSRPGQLNYGSVGSLGISQLGTELFSQMTGIKMQRVPYKGSAPALIDLVSGQLQAGFNTPISAIQHIRNRRLRAIAVSGAKRSPQYPDVEAIAETYPDYAMIAYSCFAVRKETPEDIKQRMNRLLMDALYEPAVMEKVKQLGMTPEPQNMTIAQCEAFVAREREIWTRAIKLAKIEPQ